MSDLLRNYVYEEPTKHHVFEPGEYPFEIIEVNDVEYGASSGNPFIPVKLEFSDEGRTTNCYENLVFTDKAKWKVDSFLKCVWPKAEPGKQIDWTSAEFTRWLVGKKGRAKLIVEPVKGKDYDRNSVAEFLYGDEKSEPVRAARKPDPDPLAAEDEDDDDIPF